MRHGTKSWFLLGSGGHAPSTVVCSVRALTRMENGLQINGVRNGFTWDFQGRLSSIYKGLRISRKLGAVMTNSEIWSFFLCHQGGKFDCTLA